MNTSKHLVSLIAASAIVSAVGLAYAQTASDPPAATPSAQAQPSTASPSDTMGSTATEPTPRADRN